MLDKFKSTPAIMILEPGESVLLDNESCEFVEGSERIVALSERGEIIERLDYHSGDTVSADTYKICTARGFGLEKRKVFTAPVTKDVYRYAIKFNKLDKN